jgi:protoporphyrinogen oxidase
MDCKDISADWAAQRIKGLNLFQAIVSSFGFKSGAKDKVIKTLIGSFRYPKLGPGAMWERARDRILEMGGDVRMGATIDALAQDGSGRWQVAVADAGGRIEMYSAQHVISTTSITELIELLGARVPAAVRQQADGLRYRDFLIVGLIMKGKEKFADNWVYIHDPEVKVGRIQNFKSWSPFMVPDPSTACYGLEYFCFEGDGIWSKSDASLIALATKEIDSLGLASADAIIDGTVIRQRKAYPVYDEGYQGRVDAIREGLASVFSNLHFAGRNGMHKYNNQDHAMMTGMLTARNIIAGKPVWDVWAVNQDAEYHESGQAGAEVLEERLVPRRVA